MSTTKPKCPYSGNVSKAKEVYSPIEEHFELQYNEHHEVEKVSIGEFDIIAEINSHRNEVGLLNVIRLAIAHGEDPAVKFAKTGPGVPVAVDPNITADEMNELVRQNDAKLEEIAKTLGVTLDVLKESIKNGSLNQLIENYKPEDPVQPDDGGEK